MKPSHPIVRIFIALALLVSLAACGRGFVVLETLELDRVPVLVVTYSTGNGYEAGEVLLGLLTRLPGKVTVSGGTVEIIARYDKGHRRWTSLTKHEMPRLPSLEYRFATRSELAMRGVVLPTNLGRRSPIIDDLNDAIWFRVAAPSGTSFKIEVAFATDPLTIRKVEYRPDSAGSTVTVDNGALLKVREK